MIWRSGLASFVVLTACTRSQEGERYDFERMRLQQRAELYGASAATPGHMTMQLAPLGAVSREESAQGLSATSGKSNGALLTTIPVQLTASALVTGRKNFLIYCAVCHGAGGFGGTVVAENMGAPRPPSLRGAALRAQPVGYLFDVATNGKGRMAPYAPQLSALERWEVVAYIQHLQGELGAGSPDERADSLMAELIHAIDSGRVGGPPP